MADNVDSSHEGNGTPGNGIVFPAVENLLSAVDALIDLDVGGSGPSSRALALVSRRQNELIRASGKCDAKVAALRRQLSQRDARIAELEAKLQAAAMLAGDSAEQAMAAASGQWQPIETAPKDEELVVLLYLSNGIIEKGIWWGCYDGWVDAREYMRLGGPTHWMPLPEPPKHETNDEGI